VGASGVYQIKNTINGKRYVGSTCDFDRRWAEHLSSLRSGYHINEHLQAAFVKYGEKAFEFKPMLVCDSTTCLWFEDRCLKSWKPEYNIALDAKAPMLGRHHSERVIELSRERIKILNADPEFRAKQLASLEKLNSNPEFRANQLAALRKLQDDFEFKEKCRVAIDKYWSDPDTRKKELERRAGEGYRGNLRRKAVERSSNPEVRSRLSRQAIEQMSDPTTRKNLSIKTTERMADSKNREHLRTKATEQWDNPEWRSKEISRRAGPEAKAKHLGGIRAYWDNWRIHRGLHEDRSN
jgi:group I intron endonuclease